MERRNVYVIVVVVLIAGLVLSFSGLTGRSVLGKCIDSDDGDNPGVPGVISYVNSKVNYKDECYSTSGIGPEKRLKEFYCLDKITTRRYFCEEGCLENAEGIGYCKNGKADLLSDE